MHNLFLEIFVLKGIFGSLLIISLINSFTRFSKRQTKREGLSFEGYLALIVVGLGFLFLSGFYSDLVVMILNLAYLYSLKYSMEKERY